MNEELLCQKLGIEYDEAVGAPYININPSGESVTLDSGFSAEDLRKIADEMDRIRKAQSASVPDEQLDDLIQEIFDICETPGGDYQERKLRDWLILHLPLRERGER